MQVISTDSDGPFEVLATDLDRDLDIDILFASFDDNKIIWIENEGQGNFGLEKIISIDAGHANSVYATDLDGDGDTDVLSASTDNNKIAWYENDGQGDFGAQQIITTLANRPHSVYATDLDGDGDADVISGSGGDAQISWYENLQTAMSDFTIPNCLIAQDSMFIENSSNFILWPSTTYQWILEDVIISTDKNLQWISPPLGIQSLSLITCTNTSCDTLTKTLKILNFDLDPLPVLQTHIPYTFTNTSEYITNWVWDFGDGEMAEIEEPTHTYTEPGIYELEISIYNLEWGNDCFMQLEYEVMVTDDGTGVSNTSDTGFSLSPNPAYNLITLIRPYPAAEAGFIITDLSGREILRQNLGANSSDEIDIRMLKAGIYFCKIAGSSGVEKLVVVE